MGRMVTCDTKAEEVQKVVTACRVIQCPVCKQTIADIFTDCPKCGASLSDTPKIVKE
jgi:hypothetical protein